jgi:hypothetical protein
MTFPAYAITSADRAFNPIRTYYRIFPQEICKHDLTLSVTLPVISLQRFTFLDVINTMIDNASSADRRFLLISHGLMDAGDFPHGLSIPLTSDTDMKVHEDILSLLEQMMRGTLSEADQHRQEDTLIPRDRNGRAQRRMPRGTLARLHARLTVLRNIELNRVEIRACNLGLNTSALSSLGRVLNTDFIGAPNVHMFYGAAGFGQGFRSRQGLDNWHRQHAGARLFERAGTDEAISIRVNGTGPARTTDAGTNSTDPTWFAEEFIMASGSNYRHTGRTPTTVPIAGMDETGTQRFSLPLEAGYESHLVLEGPLRRT